MGIIPELTGSEKTLIFWQLFTSLFLIGVIIAISYRKKLTLEKRIVTAAARGFIQLLILALILAYIFSVSFVIFQFLILGVMILFGAQTAAKRLSGVNNVFRVEIVSLTIAVYSIMIIITILKAIPIDSPEIWIPIGGMATGNSMNISYLTINRIKTEIDNRKNEVETALSLGLTPAAVLEELDIISSGMRLGITPNMNNLRTLGLVFIPGLMTGLLIGGISPIVAAVYQVMIFFVIISTGLVASFIASYLIIKELFNMRNQCLIS
ncbi:MAG: ABC transporter permease [Candidatus Kariarchaeaceae archaeon]|jgi:putative ABC transport system permease protein